MTEVPKSQHASDRRLDERDLAWLQLSEAGVSVAEIARRFGVTTTTVYRRLAAIRADLTASESCS